MSIAVAQPPQTQRTEEVLTAIAAWEHWNVIEQVAHKEYGVTSEEFARVLPEYQRFLGLIALGHTHVGMYSEQVDKIWHSQILSTTLYGPFCDKIFGRFIHHVPNLQLTDQSNCVSPDPCASRCLSICKTPRPDPQPERKPSIRDFVTAYKAAYGQSPDRQIWHLLGADADGYAG